MEKDNNRESIGSKKNKEYIIHCKVVGGTQADIYEIGDAMKEFSKTLPFKLHAIITNENVTLQDTDTLLMQLYELKKQQIKAKESIKKK